MPYIEAGLPPLLAARVVRADGARVECRLVRGARGIAYRLELWRGAESLLCYEGGGGEAHRRTLRGRGSAYAFRSLEQLRYDFAREAEAL